MWNVKNTEGRASAADVGAVGGTAGSGSAKYVTVVVGVVALLIVDEAVSEKVQLLL